MRKTFFHKHVKTARSFDLDIILNRLIQLVDY